jgi:hypothetical protein
MRSYRLYFKLLRVVNYIKNSSLRGRLLAELYDREAEHKVLSQATALHKLFEEVVIL